MGFKPAFGKGGKTALVEEESGESGSSSSSSSSSSTGDDKDVDLDEIKLDMGAYDLKGNKYTGGSGEISQGYLKVPDNNDTGKMINLIFKMYKPKPGKGRSAYRGNSRVLMYNEAYSDSDPSLILGPEWKYALTVFAVINVC